MHLSVMSGFIVKDVIEPEQIKHQHYSTLHLDFQS